MINCIDCNKELTNVYYKCTKDDYRYVDENNNLIYIKDTHNLDINNEEVNTEVKDIYCTTCNKPVYYPTNYENNFKNNDIIIKIFPHYKTKNIIHQFTNMTCKYCNTNILEKGYFTNTEMEQTEENLLKYAYPIDFTNTIHIYNEETNTKIKDITIMLNEINPIPETDIGKKILYCPSCNFFIMNNLQEIYKSA